MIIIGNHVQLTNFVHIRLVSLHYIFRLLRNIPSLTIIPNDNCCSNTWRDGIDRIYAVFADFWKQMKTLTTRCEDVMWTITLKWKSICSGAAKTEYDFVWLWLAMHLLRDCWNIEQKNLWHDGEDELVTVIQCEWQRTPSYKSAWGYYNIRDLKQSLLIV